MEYCNGGNVQQLIDQAINSSSDRNIELWQIRKIALDVAKVNFTGNKEIKPDFKGLNFIHQKGLVHMDIKPDNIFR